MANIQVAYGASSAVTITLASLATSASLTSGQESDAIDNTTTKNLDYLLAGVITTGTTPTAGQVEVHVVGLMNDTTWPDVFDGVNSAETFANANVKNSICRLAAAMTTDATSNSAYPFGPTGVAALFGGSLPKKFVVWVTHNTAVALSATAANHAISITPVFATST